MTRNRTTLAGFVGEVYDLRRFFHPTLIEGRHVGARTLRRIVAAIVLGLLPGPALAQTGALRGVVSEATSGEPLFAANVQIFSQRNPAIRFQRLTDRSGRFEIDEVAPGPYEIRVWFLGYKTNVTRDVPVRAGEPSEVAIAMIVDPIPMEKVVVSASRREEKALDAPAAVQVFTGEEIQETSTLTVADHLQGRPAIDVQRAGINQGTVVVRGFNNAFSGATLTMVDNRITSIPSLRYNALALIPTNNEDLEQIEVVSGPGSALYGPNTANGVLHLRTRSPFGSEEARLSVAGGNQDIFLVSGRYAGSYESRAGWKATGQAYRATDFEYHDPVEVQLREEWEQNNPGVPTRIGERDFDVTRYVLEGRVDTQTGDASQLLLGGGWSQLTAIELTGIGAVQAKDWTSYYGQGRFTWQDLFVQAYVNASDAGDTYNLRTGKDFVDQSTFTVAQAQHQARIGARQAFIYGLDMHLTRPDTQGTINGRNEDNDNINEFGAYVQSESDLSEQLDLVVALRLDKHSELENPVVSPRAALVWSPETSHKVRFTYNRAFSTPTTNNLFLDTVTIEDLGGLGAQASAIAGEPIQGYDLVASGVPETGFTFRRDSGGGVGGLYMQLPEALGGDGSFIPAYATETDAWTAATELAAATTGDPDILAVPAPSSAQVPTVLRSLDPASGFQDILPGQVRDIPRLEPTITNTIELGYKGVIWSKLAASFDVYHTRIEDFVGPLRVETPNAFLDAASLQAYLAGEGLTPQQIADYVAVMAGTALGTVTPSNNGNPADLMLTYRNFGEVNLSGIDVGLQLAIDPHWSALANYSWVSDDFWANLDGIGDIALNAPMHKAGAAVSYRNPEIGVDWTVRGRFVDGFPVDSGVFVGTVEAYTLMDFDIRYDIPRTSGTSVVLSMLNVFDHRHAEFVGTPELGRVSILRLNQRL